MPRPALSFIAVGFLLGCGGQTPAPETRFSFGYGQDDRFFIPDALQSTADAFFTPRPSQSSLAAPKAAGLAVDIDKDTLSANSGTAYQTKASRQIRLSGHLEQPLRGNLSLGAGASLFYGKSRYLLPKGAGILVDPITIRFATQGIELDTGVIWRKRHSKRVSSRFEMGVGGSMARTRTRIDSALLDVENTSTHKAGFLYTDVGLGLHSKTNGPPALHLRTRLKAYPDAGISVQTGLSVQY